MKLNMLKEKIKKYETLLNGKNEENKTLNG